MEKFPARNNHFTSPETHQNLLAERDDFENKVVFEPEVIIQRFEDQNKERGNEIVGETFAFFRDLLTNNNFVEYTSINEAYSQLPNQRFIVRREDPRQILKLFSENHAYDINFPESQRYSNCVEWQPSNGTQHIRNAYLEGFTNLNSVVSVIGFAANPDDDIAKLEDATDNFHGLQRQGVRSFRGHVTLSQVAFINLRVPGHLLPESLLTEDELVQVDEYLDARERGQKTNPVMIHRAYIKTLVTEEKQHMKEAA